MRLLGAAVVATGCGGGVDRAPVPERPTFSAEVAPILHQRCAACHRPEGPAPFPFLTYEDARERAPLIATVARARRMPPWLPGPSDYPFANERRLSERQIAILERWAAQGAVLGDAGAVPVAPAWRGGWMLGEPDLVLEMPVPYTVPESGGDIFRNFVLPVPLAEAEHVRALELLPGDARVVHHAVVAVDPTPLSREEDARDPEPGFDGMFARQGARPPSGFFVGWTPGQVTRPNPEGLAWVLEPGTDLVLQMHLRPHGRQVPVRARVGLYLASGPPARTPLLLRLGGQTIDIPAGAAAYVVADSMVLPVDVELLGLYPHAHYLAKVMDVRARLPNRVVRQLLRIEEWDFNWQDAYTFQRLVRLPAGTTLLLQYVYDNSTGNPRNPHTPPRRVVYGPNSTDEMAELWIQAVPRSESALPTLQQAVTQKGVRDRVEGWEHLIRVNPADAVAHANLASYHEARGDGTKAIHHYRRAVEAQDDFAQAHYNLALLIEARGGRDSAIHHYREAIRSRPDHVGARNNLGVALLGLNRRDEAARQFRRVLDLDPDNAEAHNNLGGLLREAGRTQEAIAHFRKVMTLRPNAPAPRFNLALALASLGRPDEALEHLQAGVRLQPGDVEARLATAWLLATHPDSAARRPDEALRLAEHAARVLDTPHPLVLDVLAAAHAAAGRFAQAESLAVEALRLASRTDEAELSVRIRGRLELYRRARPYTEPVP